MTGNTKIIILIVIGFLSCRQKEESCNIRDFKNLELNPVSVVLKVPEYITTDTIRCCDSTQIFNREIKSLDSSVMISVGVKSYRSNVGALPGIRSIMVSQKRQVEAGQDSMQLIAEAFKTIDSIEIGYLKYLDTKRNRYECRIFFIRDFKFVDIWLFERYSDRTKGSKLIVDCVFENIEIGRLLSTKSADTNALGNR